MTRLSRIARAAFAWMIPLAMIVVGCGVFFVVFTILGLGLDALFAWLAG